MQLLLPDRFDDPGTAAAYFGTVFEQVAAGERPATVSITPSAKHVGMTRRDTRRPGFDAAVRAAHEEGFPVLVRGTGGGAIAAHHGTFGFSIVRPAEDYSRDPRKRYDEAAALVMGAFARLGVENATVGEVRDEFCPGDHSIRSGSYEDGMKLVGIAQRVTKKATSVGGIVLVHGEGELVPVLTRVYAAMNLPLRPESVGSLSRAGHEVSVEDAVAALAEESRTRYDLEPAPPDEHTIRQARSRRDEAMCRVQKA